MHHGEDSSWIEHQKANKAHEVEEAAKTAIRSTVETVCWNCKTEIIVSQCKIDPPYGSFCPNPSCGKSHRNHPLLGVGMTYDRAIPGRFEMYKKYLKQQNTGR